MKTKIVLGIMVLVGIVVGTYIYQNRYSFYRYLPAEDEFRLQNINSKLYDESGKLFSGRVKSESDLYLSIYSYKDGELDGLNVIYYKNQIKETGHWKEGKQNGLFQLYTEDGILIDHALFKNGERDGLTEQFYNDTGKIRISGNYKNGILDGEYKVYYPNEKLQAETYYVNGELNGAYIGYYENGNIKLTGNYKENLPDGEWKFYLEKGNLQSIVNYKVGELNGLKEEYYENGNLWTRKEFKNSIQEGVHEVYYEDGTPKLKAKIKDGYIVEEQRFNRDGTVYGEQDERVVINESIGESDGEITIKEIFD